MKNEHSKIQTLAECKECKKVFQIDNSNVMYQQEFQTSEGQVLFLTYYDCPQCGARHFVQIDDQYTMQQQVLLTREMGQLMVLKNKNKSTKKQSAKFKANREHLATIRRDLANEYNGNKVAPIGTDTYFVLELLEC